MIYQERMRTTKDFVTDMVANATVGAILNLDVAGISFLRFSDATQIRSLINGFGGQELVFANANTASLEVSNEDTGGTASGRIITGTGASVYIAAGGLGFLKYDLTTARWRLLAGGGSSGFDAGANAVQSLAAATSMATIGNGMRKYRVDSTGGEVVLSMTPFGATQASEGAAFLITGTSDTNYPIYRPSSNNEGFRGQGDFAATNGAQLFVCYDSVSRRWVEISRSTPVLL